MSNLLSLSSPSEVEERGIDLRRDHEVIAVDSDTKTVAVETAEGETIEQGYDDLLVATGGRAETGSFNVRGLDGAFTLHDMNAAAAIDAYIAEPDAYDPARADVSAQSTASASTATPRCRLPRRRRSSVAATSASRWPRPCPVRSRARRAPLPALRPPAPAVRGGRRRARRGRTGGGGRGGPQGNSRESRSSATTGSKASRSTERRTRSPPTSRSSASASVRTPNCSTGPASRPARAARSARTSTGGRASRTCTPRATARPRSTPSPARRRGCRSGSPPTGPGGQSAPRSPATPRPWARSRHRGREGVR